MKWNPLSGLKLKPGQFWRNTDTGGCLRRIRAATAGDLDDLMIGLAMEASRRPRKKLIRAMTVRIDQLREEKGTR